MTELEIFALLKPWVDAALTANSIDGEMVQAYQPTAQGQEARVQIVATKIGPDHRHGWPKREDVWNDTTEVFDHAETQFIESIFQIGCIGPDPTNPIYPKVRSTSKTASDILGIVAAWLQSERFIEAIHAVGVGVQRVTDIRNMQFKDDHDQWRQSPSFDFTISHKQVTMFTVPEASPIEVDVHRV